MNKCVKINAILGLFILMVLFIKELNSGFSRFDGETKEDIPYLYKKGEIKENFSDKEGHYFLYIDDLCCDDENNLYVADSGWNKIFKFNSEGKYINSFGREGQGPGEFLAQPNRFHLKITFGNDKKIYVTDRGNKRVTIFSKNGKSTKQFFLPFLPNDSVDVNSKGDIYLVSKSGVNAVDCYDKNFKLKSSILDIKLHYEFPFFDPPWQGLKIINDKELKKMITKEDHIVIISNNSLKVFHFDERHNLVNSFMIKVDNFINDYEMSLKRVVSQGKFIFPFYGCLDNEENLFVYYLNRTIQLWEIYRYKLDGKFIDILRFPEKIRPISCIDGSGNIYAALNESSIGIYRNQKKGGKR